MGNYFDDVTLTLTVPTGTGTAVDVSCDVTAATLTPDTPEEIRKRLCGQKTVTGTTTWVLELEYDQNWAGALADFTVEWPLEDTQATGVVRLKPGPFGGTAGEIAEASVSLGLDGEPVFAPIGTTTTTTGTGGPEGDETGETVGYEKKRAA